MGLQEANKKIYEWADAAIKITLTSESISSTRGDTLGVNGWSRVNEESLGRMFCLWGSGFCLVSA